MTIQHTILRQTLAYVGAPQGNLELVPVDISDHPFPDARCPVDGALLRIETSTDWSHGMDYPEPGYTQYCPLCDLEWAI